MIVDTSQCMYWHYLVIILRHKWEVLKVCWRMGIPWLGVIHDWSKLLPVEFHGYARKFGHEGGKHADSDDGAFRLAWLHHQKSNKHHWQWWVVHIPVLTTDKFLHGESKFCVPIPSRYRREMLADWIGAGRAYKNASSVQQWYTDNKDKILLHPETRKWVEDELFRLEVRDMGLDV